MSIRSVIHAEITKVSIDQHKSLKNLDDDLVLLDSGLDSLCFAILVTRLEDKLGFDPFTMAEDVYFPVTLGDLIGFYEAAAQRRDADTLVG